MKYKKGMYIKKTFMLNNKYIIGMLIEPLREGIPLDQSQDWIVKVYKNHEYMDNKKTRGILLIPTGDSRLHEVKVYKDYSSLVADVL